MRAQKQYRLFHFHLGPLGLQWHYNARKTVWPAYKPVLGLIPRCRNSMWHSPFWIVPLQTAGGGHKFSAYEKQTKITPWHIREKDKLKALSLTHSLLVGKAQWSIQLYDFLTCSLKWYSARKTVPHIFSVCLNCPHSSPAGILRFFASSKQMGEENGNISAFLTFVPFSQLLCNLGVVRASHHTNHHSLTQLLQKLSYFWLNFLRKQNERHWSISKLPL